MREYELRCCGLVELLRKTEKVEVVLSLLGI